MERTIALPYSGLKIFLMLITGMIVWAWAGSHLSIGQDVQVNATVNERTVGTEEVFSYRIQVQGASMGDVSNPQPPLTEGLTLVRSVPSTQQSVSIINGQMQQSVSFEWALRPLGEGEARILPGSVTVQGNEYQVAAIDITVVPQNQRPQRQQRPARRGLLDPFSPLSPPTAQAESEPTEISEEDIFIRTEPSKRTAYQNEQINITYHLYFRDGMQLRQSRLADSWDAEGFWREELDVERRPIPRTVVENGLRYNTIVLKRVAVFPTRTGELRIDPLKIEAEAYIPQRSSDPFDQFFTFRPRYEPVEVSSPAVNINVLPLPENAPESFTGGVGEYTIEARVDRTELEVGEPLQVTLTISGTGNLATLDPPPFDPPGIFELYDPQVNTSINRTGNLIRGTKTLTYVLIPRSNGSFPMPQLELTFFNPNRKEYVSTSPRPTTIKITGDPLAPVTATASRSGLPVDDIAGLLNIPASWQKTNPVPLHRSSLTYIALLLPLLALGGTLVYQRHLSRLSTDVQFARKKRAHPMARKHLKEAQQLLELNNTPAFYSEVERAVLSFIGNRLNIAEKGLTRPQIEGHLKKYNVSEQTRNKLQRLLSECDQVRFAPGTQSTAVMQEALDRTNELIVELDAALPG